MLPSSLLTMSSAPASSATSIKPFSSVPGAKIICPQCVNRNDTEPSVPRLPPFLEKAWRTSATVRVLLSVMQSTATALDGALDVVLGHIIGIRLVHRQAQARITIRVAAAQPCRHGDFLDQSREIFTALGILLALAVLDVRPFTMPCHTVPRKKPAIDRKSVV